MALLQGLELANVDAVHSAGNANEKLLCAAQFLENGHSLLSKLDDLAKAAGTSRRQMGRLLRAAAECAVREQHTLLQRVVEYLGALKASGAKAVALVHKISYDETPLHIRCRYEKGPTHAHKAKLFVIQEGWVLHTQLPPRDPARPPELRWRHDCQSHSVNNEGS